MVDNVSMHKIAAPNTAPGRVRKADQKNDNFFNKNFKQQYKNKDEKFHKADVSPFNKDEEENKLEPEGKADNTFHGRIIDIRI